MMVWVPSTMSRKTGRAATGLRGGRATAIALLLMTIGGCASTPVPNSVQAPPLAERFANGTADGPRADAAEGWWHSFGDPVLDRLVERSLTANLDVRVAVARISQARARSHAAVAERRPEVDAGLGAGGQRISGYQVGFDQPATAAALGGAISVSWEPDLFGRFASGIRAANQEVVATQEDMRAARIAVAAEVAGTYFAMRGLDRRLALLRDSLDAEKQTVTHTRLMFEAGTANRGDLDRVEAQLASTTGDIPPLEREHELAVDRLSVLLASTPQDIDVMLGGSSNSQVPLPDLAPGVPADLLRSRPDVKAAEARLLAAYARIGIAEADLKPRLQLSGMIGSLVDAFSGVGFARSVEWLASASGVAPLIDGGRRRSVVDLRRAEAEEARLHYQSTVLAAVRDVEDALASRTRDAETCGSLETAAARTRDATHETEASWRAGVAPILDVLEARRAQLAAEDRQAQADTIVLRDQVALYAALGSDGPVASPARPGKLRP